MDGDSCQDMLARPRKQHPPTTDSGKRFNHLQLGKLNASNAVERIYFTWDLDKSEPMIDYSLSHN
jgi:hypothetical protein